MQPRTLLLVLSILFTVVINAQTNLIVGTAFGTSSTSGPSSSTTAGDRNERHMCIYTATELTTSGITSGASLMNIAWEKTGAGFYYSQNLTIRVWLKHSAATTFAANPNFATETAGATLVYQTTTGSIPSATGWINFPFNTVPSFAWNGVQHLEVITEIIRPTDWTETGFLWRTINTVTNAAANANGTIAAPPATLTRTGTRPQIRLGVPTTGNDAALIGITNPVSGSAGVQNIDVQLKNTGTTVLNTASISWTINAGAPTVFPWVGVLAPGALATVTVGSNSFGGGPHTIQATVSNPNGLPDVDPSNNSVSRSIVICTPMSGAYTINKTLPTGGGNFNSVTDLSYYLSNCGVGGNVTATIAAGTGPYLEQVVFQNIPGIGAAATVTLQGNGETMSTSALINQTGSNPNRHIIRLIGLQYFTINNLHIDMFPGSTGFIGIHILNSGNNIVLSNNVVNMGSATSTLLGAFVANSDPAGILFPGGIFDNITFTGNTVTGGGYGVSVDGLASPLATNIVISNNNFNDFNSNGVYLRETNGAHVRNNNFDKSAGTVTSANAIQLAQLENINGRIYNNKIKFTQTTGSLVGIYLFDGTGHKVYNNLIYDIRSTTGNMEGIRVRTGATAPEIFFNTISFDNAAATTGTLKGFREELSNTGSILRNNIFSLTQSTSNLKHAIELAVLTPATGLNSNYNVFLVPGGNIAYRPSSASFPTPLIYPTLASWQAASGQDANSFETSPLFQSLINPIPTSGVINNQAVAGTGITTDITGAARGAAPDPGAYEFSPPAGDASISDFILPAIPHCAATLPVQFELTNAGADPLNTVTINWTMNGVPQPAVNWAGPTLASGASTIVTLGTIPVAPATVYNFSATTSLPNGNPDVNTSNDNFTYAGFRKGFDGTVTINGSAPVSVTNYQSFQTLADDLNTYGVCAAVTINVLNGPYTEQVVFNTIPGTSAVNRVTLNGNNRVLQYNPTVAADDHILQLNAVNYMIVENLTVNSLHPTQGRGIHITNGSSKLAIRNNTVNVSLNNSTSISFGIIVSGDNWLLDGSLSDSVVISGNTVSGGYSAIQLSGVHWTQPLTRMTVSNNTVLDWYGFGVYLSYTNNALVSGNTIRRPLRTNSGSDAVTPAGITIPAGSLGFILDKNRIYDLHVSMPGSPTISRGVYVSGTPTAPTSGTIRNNLIYGMNNDGAQYGIQHNSQNGPVNIWHNTIVLNNATGAGTSNTNAINMSNTLPQIQTDIRNNIFVVTRGGTGIKRIIDVSAASSVPGLVSNYNIAWLNAPGGTQTYGQVGSTNYNTFANWQTGTNKDLNSIFVDPAFVNPPGGNFTPGNAFCDGAFMLTASVGVVDDILGTVRSVNPDAGAFEFNPPPCSGASGGTITGTGGGLCGVTTATLMGTGFSAGPGTSYQWQSSTDNFVANVVDMPGQTNPFTASTGAINVTMYYRLRVTCASGPLVGYSNIIMVIVLQPGSWMGLISTDWNTGGNWCGGVPTSTTDIIIPSSAPNMPNLSAATGSVRSIAINSGGTLTVGTGGVLNIYGDMVSNGTFNSTAGSLAFRGTSSQSIAAFQALNVTMNGTGGIVLTGNAAITNSLTLTTGNITLGANNISLSNSSTGSVGSHIITNGTGNVIAVNFAAANSRTVPVGINASGYSPVTLFAEAGHITDNFSINLKQGVFVNGVSGPVYTNNVVDRTWNINEGIAGGSNVTLIFQWQGSQELPLFQRNRSYVIRHNGTSWIAAPQSPAGGTDPYQQILNGVTAFSPFAVRSEDIPGPITGIYPNPASSVLNVVLDLPVNTGLTFSIYDAKGSLVQQIRRFEFSGISRTALNVERLASGSYLLKVSSPNDPELLSQWFVK